MQKIRLLHLLKSLDIGGIEKSTILYSNELIEKVDFIGIFARRGKFDEHKILSRKILRFFPTFNNYFFFPLNFFLLQLTIIKNNINIIHYHHRIFIPIIFFLKILNPSIVVIYTHHNIFHDFVNKVIIATSIISLNNSGKLDIPKYLQTKITVIPHGIKLQKVVQVKRTLKTIGFVGRFTKSKNIFELLEVFSDLCKVFPEIKLTLSGEGELLNDIKIFVKTNNLQEKIIIRTNLNDDIIYQDLDILVLPSENLEGFGIVLLEAWNKGIPSIVRKLEVYEELSEYYKGLIITDNIKNAIINLIENPNIFHKFLDNSLNIDDRYNIESVTNKYLNLYQKHFLT